MIGNFLKKSIPIFINAVNHLVNNIEQKPDR